MEITINLFDLLKVILFLVAIIALVYLIIVLKNVNKATQNANRILEDTKVISAITASRAEDVDPIIGNALSILTSITEAIKGNQSVTKAVSSVVHGFTSFVGMAKKDKKATTKKED